MKDLEDWAAVQRVYKQTGSIRRTASLLSISRNTVRRLLKLKTPPAYGREIYHSKLDEFKEQIIVWRCEPYLFNGTRIFRELKKKGYEGSIGPVYRFLRKVDEDAGRISSKATVRHESPPGDQAQFDWSEYSVDVYGREVKVYCFSMILAASRKKAVCFSLKADADAIYTAIQELFADLAGVTLELLVDNPKALVIENDPKSEEEIRYNPQALMLAKHLGTELNACPCYWPRKKGKIERPFDYISEQFIKGNRFADMEDLNRRGKEFVDAWCDEKHTTTQRIPNQHYLLEEKALLQPLPKSVYHVRPPVARKVSPDSFVHISGSSYSVPVRYVGKTVSFRLTYGFRIELYDKNGELFQTMEASDKKHGTLVNPEHYEPIAPRIPTSIPQIRRDFTQLYKNGERYLAAAGRRFDQPTHYARKIMELGDLYETDVLDYLIGVAVDEGKLDMRSFKALLREYNSGKREIGAGAGEAGSPGTPEDPQLTRDCSYYEDFAKEGYHAGTGK
ncbi:MAG: IS21 family transposase [Clostridiales bacterium]|nr:IS21 family transposase [Clostridiales bacterium]